MTTPTRSLLLLAACFAHAACAAPPEPLRGSRRWTFDDTAEGKLPAGFVVDATRRVGALATWEVVAVANAPSAPKVLALTYPNHKSYDSFNLCWVPGLSFRDGVLGVKFCARSGKEDQGGGLIWRATGPNDYYVVRLNPLESNLRLYHVVGGTRTMLASADCAARTGEWHELRIEHRGDWITCSVDGQERLSVRDATLTAAGGIGLWTKADAATEFDDLVVQGPNG
jgi:hypothetical protein